MTYLIKIEEPEVVVDEALDFFWLPVSQIPIENKSAYNQHFVLQRAAEFILKFVGKIY